MIFGRKNAKSSGSNDEKVHGREPEATTTTAIEPQSDTDGVWSGSYDDTAAPAAPVNGAGQNAAPAQGDAPVQQHDPDVIKKISAVRTRVHETFGQVALSMMAVPRYRQLSIMDLNQYVLEPLIRDRIAIATAPDNRMPGTQALAGIAIWASVSEEADARIREQIKAGVFPIRLKPEDWNSGSINWLLDVIAPSQRLTTSVIANFRQVVKEGDMRIHPIVTRLVDPEALKKMGAGPIKTDNGAPAPTG
ncbi:MAG: toxin-activating lysine-acyltransferase [Hyphomicrobiaceae bacterium]